MIDIGFIIIIVSFLIYYLLLLVYERKVMSDPRDIFDKFLAFTLFYAGVSIVYFSITGDTLFNESEESYNIYLFIIGFIAILWTLPNLFEEFTFYDNFINSKKKKKK